MEKIIIVDNTKDNFMYHKSNGISIHSWYDDPNDSVLYDLTKILFKIAISKPEDIRTSLSEWRPILDEYIHEGKQVPVKFIK